MDRRMSPFRKRKRLELYRWLGTTCYYRGEYRRAWRAFTKAIRLCPNNPMLHKIRGEFLEAIGNHFAARRDFERAEYLG